MIPSVDGLGFIRESDIENVALPLYQGVMIRQFDFSAAAYLRGAGNRAEWKQIDWSDKRIEPQMLMQEDTYVQWPKGFKSLRVGFRDLSNPTNRRTMISTVLPAFPCNNKVATLSVAQGDGNLSRALIAALNSFALDYVLRIKFAVSAGAGSLNPFIINELPLPRISGEALWRDRCSLYVMRLSESHIHFASSWRSTFLQSHSWKSLWAVADHERLRIRCLLDAIIAESYGLSLSDYAYLLKIDSSDPKGFWRVDQDKPIELRQTTLALAAFRDLKHLGLECFLDIPDPGGLPGCGWQIPDSLNIAIRDGIIEFDAKGGTTLPVRERLGPRFVPWQVDRTPEESWAECELHARNIIGEKRFKQLGDLDREKGSSKAMVKEPSTSYEQNRLFRTGYTNLFGQDVEPPSKKR